MQAIILKDGHVGGSKVLQGLGYRLDESAVNTIKDGWRFSPGTLNGQPVDVLANIGVFFLRY
jgi:outer membrane biosynthesis protein TonB